MTGKVIIPTPTKALGNCIALSNNKLKNKVILMKPTKIKAGSSDIFGKLGLIISNKIPAGNARHAARAKGDQPVKKADTVA